MRADKTDLLLVWEKLTPVRLIFCLAFRFKFGKAKVLFIEDTRGTGTLKKIASIFFEDFIKIDIGKAVRKGTKGHPLRYESDGVTWEIVSNYLSRKNLEQRMYENENENWKRIIYSCYAMRILRKTEKFFLINSCLRKQGFNSKKKILFMDSFSIFETWSELLMKKSDFSIYSWPNFFQMFLPLLLIGRIFFLWIVSFTSFKNPKTNLSLNDKEYKVFEEHINDIFIRYPHAGHLFWFKSSNIDAKKVVLFFDRPDSYPLKKNIEQIEKRGFSWIEMKNKTGNLINLQSLFKILKGVGLPKNFRKTEFELYATQLYFAYNVEAYRNILKKFKVKVIHQHQECWPMPLSLALAAKLEDAVFIWNHWSVDHYPVCYYKTGFADIVFSWGEYNDGYFNSHGYKYQYMLQTGLIAGENITDLDKDLGTKIRRKFPNHIDFVLTLLDSSHSDTSIESPTYELLEFYEQMLKFCVRNKSWGIIIQSKGTYFETIKYHRSIHAMLETMISQHRCVISSTGTRLIPSCLASDISVCFQINSAGLIAALASQPVIYWDMAGQKDHPIYKMGVDENIVFRDFQAIRLAINSFQQGNRAIGDHEDWVEIFDPFRDGRGPERTGKIINAVLEGFEKGKTKDDAIKDAVLNYIKIWGNQKVSKYGENKKHSGNLLWKKVLNDIGRKYH